MKKFFLLMLTLCFAASAFCQSIGDITVDSVLQRLSWHGAVDVFYTVSCDTTHAWDVTFAVVKNGDTIPVNPVSYTCKAGRNNAVINLNSCGHFTTDATDSATFYLTLVNKGPYDAAAEQAALEAQFAGKDLDKTIATYDSLMKSYALIEQINAHSFLSIDTVNDTIKWNYYYIEKPLAELDSTPVLFEMSDMGFYVSPTVKDSMGNITGLMTVITTAMSLFPAQYDEIQKCLGAEAELSVLDANSEVAMLENLFGTFPVKREGLFNMTAMNTDMTDKFLTETLEKGTTLSSDDLEICKCLLNSDVMFKAVSKAIEALQVTGYPWSAGVRKDYEAAKKLQELRNR